MDTVLAHGLHVALAAGVILAIVLNIRRGMNSRSVALFAMVGAVIVSPYAFNYDMTAMSLATLIAIPRNMKGREAMAGSILWTLLWLLPIAVLFFNNFRFPISPLLIVLGLVWLWRNGAPGASLVPLPHSAR